MITVSHNLFATATDGRHVESDVQFSRLYNILYTHPSRMHAIVSRMTRMYHMLGVVCKLSYAVSLHIIVVQFLTHVTQETNTVRMDQLES